MGTTHAAFDLYALLVEFKVPAEKAHAVSEAYNQHQAQIRKEVLETMKDAYQTLEAAAKVESKIEQAILDTKTALEKSILETRHDLEGSIRETRADLQHAILGTKNDLLKAINDQTWKLVTFSVVINGAMLGIFKFLMN